MNASEDPFNNEPKEELDEEDIWESIRDEGQLVGQQEWDSGGPGAGAGAISIYLYRGVFYFENDAEGYGPFDAFLQAADRSGLFAVTAATKRIWVKLEF